MVISELVRNTALCLKENPRFEAELMVINALGIDRTQLIIQSNIEVNEQTEEKVSQMVKRRILGEPLQYILGECEFMSLSFCVDRGVLIPRSDTETLVEAVLEEMGEGQTKILDICAGSGCIGISIAHYKSEASVCLVDISDKALAIAKKNIERNNVEKRVKILKNDILRECPSGKYDIIVSNPPYIETEVIAELQAEVRDFEPRLALDGGKDGLIFYRRITDIAPLMLDENGVLAFEIGYNQGESVKKLMENAFTDVRIIKDLCQNDRVVIGRLK